MRFLVLFLHGFFGVTIDISLLTCSKVSCSFLRLMCSLKALADRVAKPILAIGRALSIRTFGTFCLLAGLQAWKDCVYESNTLVALHIAILLFLQEIGWVLLDNPIGRRQLCQCRIIDGFECIFWGHFC